MYGSEFMTEKISTPISMLPAPAPVPLPAPAPKPTLPPSPPLSTTISQPKYHSKREILRILNYSFIILFALGLYSLVELVIKENVISNDLSYKQEIGIRFAYPIILFIGLYSFKYFI